MTQNCECGLLLAAGAYGGWWCPVHKSVTPHLYVVEAIKQLHGKLYELENWKYNRLQMDIACTKLEQIVEDAKKGYFE